MSFGAPHFLWLLLVPIVFLGWDITHRRRAAAQARPKILRAEAGPRSLQFAETQVDSAKGSRPRIWLTCGLVLSVIALARPQWGRLEEPVFDQSREILLAVDLSRSMLAPDVKPSRLERSKLLIQSLLEKLAGERVGLVVFSGTAFLQSPLSADYEILREFLPALNPEFLPQGGTNYTALIDTALQAFSTATAADRFLVILSDGEATDDDWKEKLGELSKKGIRVIGLGVGTASGAMIPDANGQFVKDERGAVVLSKLESATLQQLATTTNGVYRDASGWVDLATLVNETIAAGRKGEFVEKNTVRLVERFQWPLAFALWCLLVSFYAEFPVRPRTRNVALRPSQPATPAAAGRATKVRSAAASLVIIAVVLAGSLVVAPLHAAASLAKSPAAATAPGVTGPHGASNAAPAIPGSPAGGSAAAPDVSPLGKIVGRLAAMPKPTARDWADLGRETASWGSRLQSEKQPVPEGPVRDALTAVDLGAKLDAKATDWPKLREELQALLKKPEDEKQDDKPDQDNKDDQQQQQNQDQQKQEQDKNQKQQQKSGQPQSSPQDQKEKSQQDQQKSEPKPPEQPQQPGESAFGDMSKKEQPPPPPPQGSQKVGGAPERKEAPEPVDPALALPTQKLEQLRAQDSPAQLFQLMEGEKKPVKKTGKDW